MSTLALDLEPISPELVLVAPPDVALRARASLPLPVSTLDLLAAHRPEAAQGVEDVPERPRRRRLRRRPVLVAAVLLSAAGVAVAWVERPTPLRPYFAAPVPARPAPAQPAVAPQPPAPASSAGFVPARVWLWSPDAHAKAYLFELALDGRVVLRLRTTQPRLVLPRSFRFRAGTYRWSVHRIGVPGSAPLTDSRFALTAAAAALANP